MKIGYIRISTTDQNTARQEVLMQELNVEQVFIDRMSGKNTDRPELKRMMSFVREGDTVIVESISRFARSTKDLLELENSLPKNTLSLSLKRKPLTPQPQPVNLCLRFSERLQSLKENTFYKGSAKVWP